jgi:signal transduction histidine kinase/PAS domain-containing protein
VFDSLNNEPVLVFLLGAIGVMVIAVPLVLWLGKRLSQLEIHNSRLAAEAEQGREILAAAPDGLFLWDHPNAKEKCSRRLAVLLGLDAGTGASFDDVLAKFNGHEARALAQAVEQLHRKGVSFGLLLKLDGRTVQATGTRASKLDGSPLDDLMWMRDVTGEPRSHSSANPPEDTAAQDHFHQLLDTLPLPVWIRNSSLGVVFSNRAEDLIKASQTSEVMAGTARAENQAISDVISIDSDLFDVSEIPARGWGGTIGFAEKQVTNNDAPAIRDPDAGANLARDEVLDNLSTAIAIFGPDRCLSFCNSAYASLWQFDLQWLADAPSLCEILERLRDRRQLPEVADFRVFKEEQKNLFGNLSVPRESLLHLPDGRTLRAIVAPYSADGLVFSFEDVSDRLDLERSFKTLNAVQRETLDNLYEGIAVFGSDGKLKLSNPAFSQLWGLAETVLAGDPHLSDVINATRPQIAGIETWSNEEWLAYVKNLMSQYSSRQATSGRLQLINGAILDYSSVPLPDGAVLLSYLDVSDSARVEAALRQRADAMSQANRLKSEFIANVSYEVRTPLTTLKGFAEILAQEYFGKLNARQKEYCQGILDSSEGLTSVINDILDMASIEAGMMTLELDTVEIHAMLASVLNLINERARRKALEINFDCPPDIGWIIADEKRLKQVLFYLLSNAVNVSPARGTVRLETRRDGEKDDATISFIITGLTSGVSQTEQLDIFSGLNNPAEGMVLNPGQAQMGAGLGLSLVQRFVELHGGDVQVKSPQGKGTTITCRLPATGSQHNDQADLSMVSG